LIRTEDLRWMTLALAAAGRARPAPNPPVGAVIVQEGAFVSLGWHERAGAPHAEIVALQAARERVRGATLYVTLEPCNHHGRTPPCVDAILAAGLRRVVVGCRDPNPTVTGGGLERLQRHGLEAIVGTLGLEAQALIEEWMQSWQAGAGPHRRPP
jgi:diaminohydroxyphosphoribosylaminopyrimidine deaminase / 5-amino-6-(5-phosphoribosylamino)uracil reductase